MAARAVRGPLIRKLVVVAVVVGMLGCASDERGTPTAPSEVIAGSQAPVVVQMGKLIGALFPRPLVAEAELRLAAIVLAKAQGKVTLAQTRALGLVDFALRKYANHELKGDQSAATRANLDALVNLLFPYVVLPAPGPLTRALAPGAAAVVITPTDPPMDVTTADKAAGVRVPTGAISTTQSVLVTVTPTLNQASPLPTALTQYGPFYDFQTFPPVPTFNQPVTIGICVDLAGVPLEVQQRLQLAYPAPGSTAVTIGPRAPTPFLDCPALPLASLDAGRSWLRRLAGWATGLFRPTPLYASRVQAGAEGGAGTQTNTFGDVCPGGGAGTQAGTFCSGAVDPNSELRYTVAPNTVATGSIMTPAVVVRVQTPFGQLITTFQGQVQVRLLDGATGLGGTVIQPVIGGVATFADLTITTPGTGRRLEAVATSTTAGAPRAVTSAPFDVTGGGLADLTIGNLAFEPASPTTSDGITLSGVVSNSGGTPAGPFSGYLCLTQFFGGGSSGSSCFQYDLPSLAAGSSAPVSAIFGTQPAGTYTVTANVDSAASAIPESDETNNSTTGPSFTVTGWATKAPMPTPRAYLGVGVVNGILYAAGGRLVNHDDTTSIVEGYDPGTNTWTTKAPMLRPRRSFGVGVVNGVLYAVGGLESGGAYSTLVEAYNPLTDSWTPRAPMPTARYAVGVGVVNGIIYVVGGAAVDRLATVEAYDPLTNSWTTKASLSVPRQLLGVAVVNGLLYAVGGEINDGDQVPGTVEVYNPVTDSWTTKTPMSTHRFRLAVGAANGLVYAVGGLVVGNSTMATLEAYDPVTDAWTTKASMPTARHSLALGVVNGVLYAVGGYVGSVGNFPEDSGIFLAANEAYQP